MKNYDVLYIGNYTKDTIISPGKKYADGGAVNYAAAQLGMQVAVVTRLAKEDDRAHRDGLLIYANGKHHEMGFYPISLDGRSGSGDTCVGTYIAMRLSKHPREAGIWAAAVTSLKMENVSPINRSVLARIRCD